MGLDQFEQTRIDHLGLPKRHTEEGDNEGHFEMKLAFNAAEQAKVLWEKEEGKTLEPGDVPHLVDTRLDIIQNHRANQL